jgi:hypothetical protein
MKLDGCEQHEKDRSISQGKAIPAKELSEVDADCAT